MKPELLYCFISSLSPILVSPFVFLFRRNKWTIQIISVLSILISSFATWNLWRFIENKPLIIAQFFYVDGFSILMQFMTELVTLSVLIYSNQYLLKLYDGEKNRFSYYYGTILVSSGFMNLTFISNNLFALYIFLELSSIIVVYLIAFSSRRESLQASFKYLIFVNVGILFSLLGIVFIYYFSGINPSIEELSKILNSIPNSVALISASLLTIGFFTKAGLIPFHVWLPDSYKEAPSPVTVFLTGSITKLGIYGLIRTLTPFAYNYYEIKLMLIILASISIIFGALLSFNQRDIKRLIAYCSISEIGFVATSVALASYLGFYGGLFHLINHTLMKGLLFFSIGMIIYTIGTTEIIRIRIKNSTIGTAFFAGALAVGGMPLFGSFLSTITIFFALKAEGFLWTGILLIISGLISALAILRAAVKIFWSEQNNSLELIRPPKSMIFVTYVFMTLLIIFGVYSDFLYPIIDKSSKTLVELLK